MKATMKILTGPDTTRVMLIGLEDRQKICEINITQMSSQKVWEIIRLQRMQGRDWNIQIIKPKLVYIGKMGMPGREVRLYNVGRFTYSEQTLKKMGYIIPPYSESSKV